MNRIYLLVIGLALLAGMAAMPLSNWQASKAGAVENRNVATNAPFRDGLYLGGLTAKGGDAPHVAAGRWSREQDRASFAEGYRIGYSQSAATVNAAR
jgi:hypothetical protein